MKKAFILLIAFIILISCVFASCSDKEKNTQNSSTTGEGLEGNDTEFGIESQDVTDKDGKKVTDKKGNTVTTNIAVVYKTDKKGKRYGVILDKDGNPAKDKNGNEITIAADDDNTGSKKSTTNTPSKNAAKTTTQKPTKPEKTTGTTKKDVPLTDSNATTKFEGKEVVPKTSATGTEVNFSVKDQNILKSMLEVPYLYTKNYENSDGVPIEIAAHTAVWMSARDGNSTGIFPSSPVVLNLFKYYGQTVVNFKTKCNKYSDKTSIKYIKANDTFDIKKHTKKVQNVSITKIEDLGNNNYYKVTGKVSGCSKKTVVAIVQKNKLDSSLGFSVKALNWK